MRAVWIDEGNDPDYAKCKAHGIDTLYFALRDPRVTRAYLDAVHARGYQVGVYAAWNWPEYSGTGRHFAERVAADVRALRRTGLDPRVQLNDETHSAARIRELLGRWRELYPYQATSWTLEGMQGGWHTPELVRAVLSARVRLAPQAYTGNMERIAEDAVLRDLTRRGYPEEIVSLFYDAAQLPRAWDGWAFTQGRLAA